MVSLANKVYIIVPYPLMSVKNKKIKYPTAGGLSLFLQWGVGRQKTVDPDLVYCFLQALIFILYCQEWL